MGLKDIINRRRLGMILIGLRTVGASIFVIVLVVSYIACSPVMAAIGAVERLINYWKGFIIRW